MALTMLSLQKDPSFGLDSRRSWVTAVFVSLCLTMALIGQHAVGILFYGIVQTYGISRQEASWPLALTHSLSTLGGPVLGYLCSQFSCRAVLLISTFTAGATMSACFFADSIFYLNVLFGIAHGTAVCGVHVSVNVLVSQHFEKRRATACSIMYTLSCINSAYLPPLAEMLRVTYGIHGTFLVLGAMVLNAFPVALAVHSPEWCISKKRASVHSITDRKDFDTAPSKHLRCGRDTKDVSHSNCTELSDDKAPDAELADIPLVQSGNSVVDARASQADRDSARNGSFIAIVREFISIPFAVNAISFSVIALGMSTFLLLAVDIALDKGILPSRGVFLLNAFALTDIIMRPLSGLVIDSDILSLQSVMLLGYVLQFLALELFVSLDSFPLLLASSALFGVSNGLRVTLLAPCVSRDVGVDRMPVVFGEVAFCSGVVLLIRPFLIGYWRDTMGSYEGLLHFVAALNAVVAGMWIAKLYVKRRHKPLVSERS